MREKMRKKDVGEYRQDTAEQVEEEHAVYFLPELLTDQKIYHIFAGNALNNMYSEPAGFENAETLRLTRIATRTHQHSTSEITLEGRHNCMVYHV